MSNEILSSIYSFSEEFIDPVSNLSFKPENKNISAIVKNGHINITLTISDSNHEKYKKISDNLKQKIEKIPNVLSINIILVYLKKIKYNVIKFKN